MNHLKRLFNIVINGLSYSNAIFWAVLIIGIISFVRVPLACLSDAYRATAQCRSDGAELAARLDIYRHFIKRRRHLAVSTDSLCLSAR